MMTDELYKSMREHPETGPVMELLELADGSDAFARALALVRDCFSPERTLRLLARDRLRQITKRRAMLVYNYEQAVITAARDRGATVTDYSAAVAVLPDEVVDHLHRIFCQQVEQMRRHAMEDGA